MTKLCKNLTVQVSLVQATVQVSLVQAAVQVSLVISKQAGRQEYKTCGIETA